MYVTFHIKISDEPIIHVLLIFYFSTPGASPGGDEIIMMNGVYKDRFPKVLLSSLERVHRIEIYKFSR